MFILEGDTITYRGVPIEVVTPEKRARAFQAWCGGSAQLASAVETGGFASRTATMAVARHFRLLCIDPDTIRKAQALGVVQS